MKKTYSVIVSNISNRQKADFIQMLVLDALKENPINCTTRIEFTINKFKKHSPCGKRWGMCTVCGEDETNDFRDLRQLIQETKKENKVDTSQKDK